MAGAAGPGAGPGAAGGDGDDSLYPIAVLIDELRNEDVQVLDWGWGAEASAEAHMVGKREGRLSRGGGSGVGRTTVGVRSGPGGGGGSAVVRLNSQQPYLPRASGVVAPAVGGKPVPASGGRAPVGCGTGRERRSGPAARVPLKCCECLALPANWPG